MRHFDHNAFRRLQIPRPRATTSELGSSVRLRRGATAIAAHEDALTLVHRTLIGEAVDCSPMLAFVADEQMRYVAVNAKACEVLGYTRAELLQLRVPDVAVESTATAEFAEMVDAGFRTGSAMLRTKSGHSLEFRYFASEARIAGLPFYLSFGMTTG